eukprot:PhF_6_TR38157/c2_g1_i1/m.57006
MGCDQSKTRSSNQPQKNPTPGNPTKRTSQPKHTTFDLTEPKDPARQVSPTPLVDVYVGDSHPNLRMEDSKSEFGSAKRKVLDLSLAVPETAHLTTQVRSRQGSVMEELVNADAVSILATLRKTAPVHRVVLTGGPCAGKSTSLGMLKQRLAEHGFNVYCVPEAATLLVTGGLTWTDMTEEKATIYQLALLRTQIALEDAFLDIAKANGKPAVILCDRGTMDGRAYCSEAAWQNIMELGGFTLEQLRDQRYEAVVHMVTAAIGAERFYNLENEARTETVEQARQIDEVLRQKYVGHPKLKIITNTVHDFQSKVDRVWDFIAELIGVGDLKTKYRRYLVNHIPKDEDITVAFEKVVLRITILAPSVFDDIHLLLARTQGKSGYYTYQNISRREGCKKRVEHRLTEKEYRSLELNQHSDHIPIVKENISFTYGDHYFELGVFQEPVQWEGTGVLYVETDEENPKLPSFIHVEREVTRDDEFSSYNISSAGGWRSPRLLNITSNSSRKFE